MGAEIPAYGPYTLFGGFLFGYDSSNIGGVLSIAELYQALKLRGKAMSLATASNWFEPWCIAFCVPSPMSAPAPTLKRPRSPSPSSSLPPRPAPPAPAPAPAPAPPLASHYIQPPSHYIPPAAPPTPFQLPLHLTSFSYGPNRELLLGEEERDQALQVYSEPALGCDLNEGFEEAVWRDGGTDEGLDALLDGLLALSSRDPGPTSNTTQILLKNNVYTWRGMMTKLLLAVYEVENTALSQLGGGGGRGGEGWEMNGMVLDGALYLEDSSPPSKLASKAASESSNKLQSYYGYSFESFCTMPPSPPSSSTSGAAPPPPPTESAADGTGRTPNFSPPNTNIQYCSLVKTSLGPHRTILGGEVDCLSPRSGLAEGNPGRVKVQTSDFVELKTNLVIRGERDEWGFERNKLLKHYVQSFLLGVPLITVGFRTRQGILTGLQSFKTLEIPRLVRSKPHSWDPSALLASGNSLLSFIFKTLSNAPSTREWETKFASPPSSSSEQEWRDWPVFRISFTPAAAARGEPGVVVRELSGEEVQSEVLGAKREVEGGRVGFLKGSWVGEVRRRRGEARANANANASAEHRPPPPPPLPAAAAAAVPPRPAYGGTNGNGNGYKPMGGGGLQR
ncbi:RAI1 like PD-XK nuclease-domain-containing protein [Leucosporidium creatinivorum]|uniref:Decapping nuclease n=1 Tax=Leucosporidium creatinivorum TaxID=106004 RepID=A0A1Y2FKX5_9BASI|nr:RAI1 like PD-XK nuclease-domain-containing protein [Leucosporidium creatinivorum]